MLIRLLAGLLPIPLTCLEHRRRPTAETAIRVVMMIAAGTVLGGCWLLPLVVAFGAETTQVQPEARIRVDDGHPWRPPFGLQRVGRPLMATVEISTPREAATEYALVTRRGAQELSRSVLKLTGQSPSMCQVPLNPWPTEIVLVATPPQGTAVELARQTVEPPAFEAEAVARPDNVVNPVDLGCILAPSNWLLLRGGQAGTVEAVAICRTRDVPDARVKVWFESAPTVISDAELGLVRDHPASCRLPFPTASTSLDRDVLHVSIDAAGGEQLWRQTIPTMLVQQPPRWPAFGAVETKLRYDAPISVRADDGTYSSMSYEQAWDSRLQDVVVALPNGSRFVFWRGSSYIPFWAGRCNTGLSYEWAETSPPPDGFTDSVEPLMDKELRYGRVTILESTPARIHVRWSYQSCDFHYKVWGDSAVEDFYFYPDGFGTRVLTLQSVPTGDYELNEFIILTPQATYPLSVLPLNLVDVLFLDGQKRELMFPFLPAEQGEKVQSRDVPAIYRVRLHNDESLAAVYFNPLELKMPPAVFAPFFDKGQLVTPTYWGSHWPLARGKTTGAAIDDRVQFTPCHNSVMSWARTRPEPVRVARTQTLDTLGRSQPMIVQTWVWLIGMSDADDARLLQWAHSFAQPPSVDVVGARLEAESYMPERRAIRLVPEANTITINIKPAAACVNPVFELIGEARTLVGVQLGDRTLAEREFAWDGQTLWINATLTQDTLLRLVFADQSPRP
jgi:hypothetical protein